jgi:geranylgeranyl pyrophosphate synthase
MNLFSRIFSVLGELADLARTFFTVRTPRRSAKANGICERVIGRLRRECLDFLIPLKQAHLRIVTKTGSHITIEVDPTAALGQASRIRQSVFLSINTNIGILFQAT